MLVIGSFSVGKSARGFVSLGSSIVPATGSGAGVSIRRLLVR